MQGDAFAKLAGVLMAGAKGAGLVMQCTVQGIQCIVFGYTNAMCPELVLHHTA
jgi:hypothetical protein